MTSSAAPDVHRSLPAGDATAPRDADTARRRIVRAPLGTGGLLGATLFFCLCLTPSLLPRSWVVQGLGCGITAALGYGAGATIGWLVRRLLREPGLRPGVRTQWVLAVTVAVLIGTFLVLSGAWQRSARGRLGMDEAGSWHPVAILLVALLVAGVLLVLARTVRLVARRVRRALARRLPRPMATVLAVALTAALGVTVLNGTLFRGFVALSNQAASMANTGTSEGTARPTAPTLSGSPDSLVPWSTLGREGRNFTGRAPGARSIAAFTGRPALEPIRAYVGLDSAASLTGQVELALRELNRTRAWNRSVLAVFTTTGTGWVDERVAASLEYLHGGDTAEVALQYSYLPSWISFLLDRSKAASAGEALITAVRERWTQLPAGHRPRLLVFGESLGSYGTESAFDGIGDLVAWTDGALLVGPVAANPLWNTAVAGRDVGSPVWLPVWQQGRTVRWADAPGDLGRPTGAWHRPRVVYLQNSSDPVVWWTPRLLLERPAWLDGERGPDVPPQMRWYPVVTFWQVTIDLVFANTVPDGHGHRYGADVADGWAAVDAPPGWSPADTLRLRSAVQ